MFTRDGSAVENEQDKGKSRSLPKGPAANGDRIRDRNGYRQRAAAFCARFMDTDEDKKGVCPGIAKNLPTKNLPCLQVLMVSGRREGSAQNYWVLPGGGVENLETPEEAVVRELREEAGILGKVLFMIGKFMDQQRFHHTTLYFLSVQETYDEWENCQNGRERRWMGMEEARQCIKQNQLAMFEQSIGVIERTLADHHHTKDDRINFCLLTTMNGNNNGTSLCPSPSIAPLQQQQ